MGKLNISLKFGWLVPIGILFVLSFPPVLALSPPSKLELILLVSFLVTKSSLSFVASSGVYGLVLQS